MGCDIHLYVERRNESGQWVSADRWTPDKYAEQDKPRMEVEYENMFYNSRNYNLFAMLANVRNGRGFAGIKTGEGFNPICEPRGLPEDASPEVKAESDAWGCGGHSHSWLTVAELLEYDWTQVSCLQGWVDLENFEEWERYGKKYRGGPEDYCGEVSGSSVEHITNDAMRELISPLMGLHGTQWKKKREELIQLHVHKYTLVEWTEPYYQSAGKFLSETMPKLWQLGNPEDVRITFWFDN